MSAYPSNQALIASINHANMSNGEVVIKLHGEVITGHIRSINMEMREAHFTEFSITGIIDK